MLTAILVGPSILDLQSFRQLLPGFGRYQHLRDLSNLSGQDFNALLLIAPDEPMRDAAFSKWNGRGSIFLLEPGRESGIWHQRELNDRGELKTHVIYCAVRHFYSNRQNFRWVFYQGKNTTNGQLLFRFNPPEYDNLEPLPPLPDFITELQNKHGLPVDRFPGLFKDQWGQRSIAERWLRKGEKLIRNPEQFWRDSRLAKKFSINP